MGHARAHARRAGAEFPIEWLDPARLIPHPLNYKRHTARQKAELGKSLHDFGWLAAPIWNRRTGHLLDGHERREEALTRGWTPIPVRVVDVDARVERRMLASFDRIGELRERDDRLLARLLREVTGEDEPPPPGYDATEVEALLELLAPPAEREAPETDHDARGAGWAAAPAAQEPYAAHVRLVNLYLTLAQHARLLAQVEALATAYGTANVTDTVVRAIHEGWERHDAGAAGAQPPEPAGVAGEGGEDPDAGRL